MIKFRSRLEEFCYDELKNANLAFKYEPFRLVLIPGFRYEGFALERVGKKFKDAWKKQQDVVYIPDFVGPDWIIETKGFERPLSKLKWKLFKSYLLLNKLDYDLYKPHSRKEVKECIKLIKSKQKKNDFNRKIKRL